MHGWELTSVIDAGKPYFSNKGNGLLRGVEWGEWSPVHADSWVAVGVDTRFNSTTVSLNLGSSTSSSYFLHGELSLPFIQWTQCLHLMPHTEQMGHPHNIIQSCQSLFFLLSVAILSLTTSLHIFHAILIWINSTLTQLTDHSHPLFQCTVLAVQAVECIVVQLA